MSDNRIYEWGKGTDLKGNESKFCPVPFNLVVNTELHDQRITLFCYLFLRRGADNLIMFHNSNLHQWCNKKPDTHKNGITTKFNKLLKTFEELGYISIKTSSKYSCTEIEFTYEKDNHFSMLWLDEIELILESGHKYGISTDILLLVFAWLRYHIFRRSNQVQYGEEAVDESMRALRDKTINQRQQRYPECYSCYLKDIADEIGIPERTVSNAIKALKNLKLIYYETLPRTKYEDSWHTNHTLFTNYYKRESNSQGQKLLASGASYYLKEIANKKKMLGII